MQSYETGRSASRKRIVSSSHRKPLIHEKAVRLSSLYALHDEDVREQSHYPDKSSIMFPYLGRIASVE